jgi:hypothetical protein
LTSAPWLAAAAAAALGFLAWTLAGERARDRDGSAARRLWRFAALCIVAVSLFLLAARPAGERSRAAGSAVLVTAGADGAAVEESAGEVFALPGAPPGFGVPITDVAELTRRRPDLERWQVVGSGLDPWQAEALPGEVSFAAPAALGAGIDRAQWRRRLALGERLEVRGTLVGPASTLRLLGPAGVEAETEVAAGESFALAATPRLEGRFLYRLELVPVSGDASEEVVAVEVTPRRLPRVLWLAGAPSFESREVKTWLRDLGGALVVRSQISRGRFLFEYLNRPRLEIARLDGERLAEFDLVVVDGAAWSALPAGERKVLDEAVRAGLGLLLLPVLPAPGGEATPAFEVAAVGDLESVEVAARGPAAEPLEPLVIPGRQFTLLAGQRSLFSDGAGRALAVAEDRGLGRVAATLLEDTYRWVLRGDGASHRRYWSELLAAVARQPAAGPVSAPVGPILVDRPLPLERVAVAAEPLRIIGPDGSEVRVAFVQDPLEARRWSAVWWPREVGWPRLVAGEQSSWWHASAADDWGAWQRRQAQEATRRRAALGPALAAAPGSTVELRELPRWPLFAVLLAAWGALWADDQWRRRVGAP